MSDPPASDQPEKDLDRIIDAVTNDEPVDWGAESRRRPDLEPFFEQLRIAESVSAYHRAQPPEEPSVAPGTHGPTRWGPLRILERIGRGGAAEVYRAFDSSLKTEVALKLLRHGAGSADRLLEEARRLARVRHPNVLVVHGVAVHDGRAGIWSDRISGLTLEELLATHGPFGAEEAIHVGVELCRALAAVHRAGLVHRDVKTTNVMREHGGRVVLMDFGAGSEGGGSDDALIEDGTPLFMAPEQLRGAAATAASDMYSLGILLFRFVTCRFPVEAQSYAELTALHERGERASVRNLRPDLPTGFVAVLDRALDPNPERRFGDAAAFERALLNASESAPQIRVHDGTWWTRRLVPWAAVLVVLSAVATWLLHGSGSRSPGSTVPSVVHPVPSDDAERGSIARSDPDLPAAPPPRVAAVAPVVTDVILRRERDGQEQDLSPGDRIAPGDALSLQLRSDEPLHIYILNEDEQGQMFALFPISDTDLKNPLPAGLHRLPGTTGGRPASWQVTNAGGEETIIAIAARSNLPVLEQELERIRSASRSAPAPAVAGGSDSLRLRGIGRVVESPVGDEGTGLDEILKRLRSGPHAPWIWRIELVNPR